MLEKIRKLKDRKGFTLVELIVVLVILAILAALLVPALTGYIDKANKEKVISEARMVLMAAQAEISEEYGNGNITLSGSTATTSNTNIYSDIKKLAEAKDGWDFQIKFGKDSNDAVAILEMSFTDGTYKVTYTNTDQFKDVTASSTCDDVENAQIVKPAAKP